MLLLPPAVLLAEVQHSSVSGLAHREQSKLGSVVGSTVPSSRISPTPRLRQEEEPERLGQEAGDASLGAMLLQLIVHSNSSSD